MPPPSSSALLQAQAAFPDLSKAADAVQRVFRVLDIQPSVDPSSTAGVSLELEGRVELRRVAFAYPSRPQRLVLKEFSLTIAAGASCALVGESGHGKSTIVGLLERFYDPVDGQVGRWWVLEMRCSAGEWGRVQMISKRLQQWNLAEAQLSSLCCCCLAHLPGLSRCCWMASTSRPSTCAACGASWHWWARSLWCSGEGWLSGHVPCVAANNHLTVALC